MVVSQKLLVIPKWAEFQEQAKGGVIIEIHSRHVSAHELKDTLETMFPHSKYTIQLRRDRYSITFPERRKCDLDQVLLDPKPSGQQSKPPITAPTSTPLLAIESIEELPSSNADITPMIGPQETLTAIPHGPKSTQREGILHRTRCLLLGIAKRARNATTDFVRP
ncbi:hypothetical protein GE21DRAFT_1219315 [Neurospora crassa]|uniref:Uncharacterized protein B15B24.050 n=1 Tax=Neurospora crassa TaxID=5141 RepID=Q873G7_NEUCS|nr:hypothetical protein GE21DRAFT_1219315 [Neurospora crassa]CAD70339.1 hypothetical protein [Neurospora crassa]